MNDVKGMNATNAAEKQRPYQRAAAGGRTVPLQKRPAGMVGKQVLSGSPL